MTEAKVSGPLVGGPSARRLLPRWLVAIGFGIPVALVVLAALPIGSDFFYVLIGRPLSWLFGELRAYTRLS